MKSFLSWLPLIALFGAAGAQGPFQPPRASVHYAPDRTCDLVHLRVDLDVDYKNKLFTGRSVNTLSPLRDGLTSIQLHAGPTLQLLHVSVNGAEAKYTRDGRVLTISTPPLKKGKPVVVVFEYKAANSRGVGFGAGGGGFHWINPREGGLPTRVGFWTQGETGYNSDWAPTWDYPNDLTTTETHTTVPLDWSVVGNGVLVSDTKTPDGAKHTVVWQMKLPHATYLLSLVGGPLDIKKDRWRGVDLWYVVPKGKGQYIDYSFGNTKDMLSFFSDTIGVKYAWPKYAQNAMYDFGGGMENVSSTTLGDTALTEPRDGNHNMDSVNSHELGHQWFGDLVTCKDWGDTWLNESFATFMEMIYFEHSRGKNSYDQEVDANTRSYVASSRSYIRPISTKLYPNADAMFDNHSYPKGGVVLHSLRRLLGDANFYAGLKLYLNTYQHQPVQATQLCRSFTEATGINCESFFDQWIFKPGHPVLDYTWTYEGDKVVLKVKQSQDTSTGTPIYDIAATVALIDNSGKITRLPVHLSKVEDSFDLAAAKPAAVILDPDHDYLREIPELHWSAEELPVILQFAPDAVDRQEALRRLLRIEPTAATVALVVKALGSDNGSFPAFTGIGGQDALAREDLRSFWLSQLTHPYFPRRSSAVGFLGKLPKDPATIARVQALVNDKEATQVVVAAIRTLAEWDAKGNADLFKKAQKIVDLHGSIKRAANEALGLD